VAVAHKILAGIDAVAVVTPTEGDVDVVCIDTPCTFGRDIAAVDGDVAPRIIHFDAISGVGRDIAAVDGYIFGIDTNARRGVASCIDGAAVDDEIAMVTEDGILFTVGIDGAAIDDEAAFVTVDGTTNVGRGIGDVEAAALSTLSVNGQVICININGVAVDGHSLVVSEDNVHVAITHKRTAIVDVAIHDVPFGLVAGADAALVAREHGGGHVVSCTVLVDVVGLYGFCPRHCAGHDELERHDRPHEVVL